MKKISIIVLTVVSVLCMCSCIQKEPFSDDSDCRTVKFVAGFVDTKTTYQGDGKTDWEKGDVISYYSNDNGTVREYEVPKSGHKTNISARVEDDSNFIIAVYGGSIDEESDYDESCLTLNDAVPAEQSGKFADAQIAIARSHDIADGSSLAFHNLTSLLKFSLERTDVAYLTFEANGGEKVHGDGVVIVSFDDNGIPSATFGDDGGSCIKVMTDGEGQYFISTLPATLAQGFTMTLYDAGGSPVSTVASNNELEISSNTIINLGCLDSRVESPEDIGADLKNDVRVYGPEYKSYITVIDETTVMYSSQTPGAKLPQEGDIIFCYPNKSGQGLFIGKVVSVSETPNGWEIATEIPAFEDVFDGLSLGAEMNSTNTVVVCEPDDGGAAGSCRIVDNSVWNSITQLYSSNEKADRAATKASSSIPVDVTIEVPVNKNDSDVFQGKVYIGLCGTIEFEDFSHYYMNVNMRIGLNGSLGVTSSIEKEFTILELKNGLTLYNNKILGVRLKPSLKFFAKGGIRVEAGLNFEVLNTDYQVSYNNGTFQNLAAEQLHDNYFRVSNLKTQGEFGLKMQGDLYAFVFTDKFLSGGMSLAGGVSLSGTKEAGIQFPDLANFNCTVNVAPFLSMKPFIAYRSTSGLQKVDGPEAKMSMNAFSIDLLPNITVKNYERRNERSKLVVAADVSGHSTSFIESKKEGIAVFKKGDETPIEKREFSQVQTRAESAGSDIAFEVSPSEKYQIAPFVLTEDDEYVYGEKIDVDKEGCPDENHIHAIDLGLSVKWACCNLGASKPEEYGGYYQWAGTRDVTDKSIYLDWSNCPYHTGSSDSKGWTKYIPSNESSYWSGSGDPDNKTILDPEDDVAHVKLGGKWRMPTIAEFDELIDNCTSEWTTLNGVEGMKFTSNKNGKSIFLPAAGCRSNGNLSYVGSDGGYWSSSLFSKLPDCAYFMSFAYLGYVGTGSGYRGRLRYVGQSVRPVSE